MLSLIGVWLKAEFRWFSTESYQGVYKLTFYIENHLIHSGSEFIHHKCAELILSVHSAGSKKLCDGSAVLPGSHSFANNPRCHLLLFLLCLCQKVRHYN